MLKKFLLIILLIPIMLTAQLPKALFDFADTLDGLAKSLPIKSSKNNNPSSLTISSYKDGDLVLKISTKIENIENVYKNYNLKDRQASAPREWQNNQVIVIRNIEISKHYMDALLEDVSNIEPNKTLFTSSTFLTGILQHAKKEFLEEEGYETIKAYRGPDIFSKDYLWGNIILEGIKTTGKQSLMGKESLISPLAIEPNELENMGKITNLNELPNPLILVYAYLIN